MIKVEINVFITNIFLHLSEIYFSKCNINHFKSEDILNLFHLMEIIVK